MYKVKYKLPDPFFEYIFIGKDAFRVEDAVAVGFKEPTLIKDVSYHEELLVDRPHKYYTFTVVETGERFKTLRPFDIADNTFENRVRINLVFAARNTFNEIITLSETLEE